MNLFIDTNIFLSFFHYSKEDLEELKKILVLIERKKVHLYLPTQVVDEFRRNRESKILDALRTLRNNSSGGFPQICIQHPEFKKLQLAFEKYQQIKSRLIEEMETSLKEETFDADKLINELFGKSERIDCLPPLFSRAEQRVKSGNPPGKAGSYGDAVNWESLMARLKNGEDLYVISNDSDYASLNDTNEISPFLKNEWLVTKHSAVYLFTSLSKFFANKFPQIKLAAELTKELVVQDLATSRSFADTRKVLLELAKFSEFTDEQLNELIRIATTNKQVSWIIRDEDIKQFFKALITGKEKRIEKPLLEELTRLWDKAD